MATVAEWTRALWDGARLRCPACRRGRTSPAWWRVLHTYDACPDCGVAFENGRGEFTGAMLFGQGAFGTVGLLGWFVWFLVAQPPLWAQLLWLGAFGVVLPVVGYRHVKGAWVGAMWAAHPWGA